jgi:hypothetical protein
MLTTAGSITGDWLRNWQPGPCLQQSGTTTTQYHMLLLTHTEECLENTAVGHQLVAVHCLPGWLGTSSVCCCCGSVALTVWRSLPKLPALADWQAHPVCCGTHCLLLQRCCCTDKLLVLMLTCKLGCVCDVQVGNSNGCKRCKSIRHRRKLDAFKSLLCTVLNAR